MREPVSFEHVEAVTSGIGPRVADIRKTKGMRVTELARRCGVSSSLISQIERGQSRPSVGTLFSIARALDVPIDAFFNTVEANAEDTIASDSSDHLVAALDHLRSLSSTWRGRGSPVLRPEERPTLDIRGGVRWERLTSSAVPGIEFLELVYQPGAESDPKLYRHPGIELVLITQGQMNVYIGFECYELRPGHSIGFASSEPHRYVNPTAQEAHAITVILRDELSTLPLPRNSGGV